MSSTKILLSRTQWFNGRMTAFHYFGLLAVDPCSIHGCVKSFVACVTSA